MLFLVRSSSASSVLYQPFELRQGLNRREPGLSNDLKHTTRIRGLLNGLRVGLGTHSILEPQDTRGTGG